jgi:hypothetical protein
MAGSLIATEDLRCVPVLTTARALGRWQDLGGLYGWTHHASTPGRGGEHLHASTPGRSARAGAGASSARDQHDLPERMLLPLPRHLSSLTDEQLHQLWEMVTAPQPQKEIVYRSGALGAIAQLIMMPGNRLHTLDLSGVALCGLDPAGKPKLTGEYRSDSIELLCDAIESENCVLKVSALMGTDGH